MTKIVVAVKYVPDATANRSFSADNTVDRDGVDGLLSELDEYAVEQALQIVEAGEGEVTVLTVGPDDAADAIRKALQMGADAGVHVKDDAIHGSDAFATSLVCEHFHASPVIAVVVAGLIVGNAARTSLEPSRVLALQGFWETAGFALNVLLFLLVGMQLEASSIIREAGAIALALLALHAGRAVAVYGTFGLMRMAVKEVVPTRWQHVMVVGNIKGSLSMAAVLALPEALPNRDRLVTIVFGVTFVTLVTQALPFKKLLVWLGVTLRPAEILGLADRLGSLEPGKDATFFVSDGDPLEIRTHIERVWIAGEELDLATDPQRQLYEKYKSRPRP